MDLQKLINTMCDIIGEKHHIRINAQIHDKGDFLHEGVVSNGRKNKSKTSGTIY